MGDSHFLLQNSLTGLIFLAFASLGLWASNETEAIEISNLLFSQWPLVALIVSTPIIGVFVQGVGMFFMYLRGHPYQSKARDEMARRIRVVIKSLDTIPDEVSEHFEGLPNDSLFVWFLYKKAPPHMIEWYRRRLTFRHLGENWATAIILGLIFGISLGLFLSIPLSQLKIIQVIIGVGVSAGMIIGLLFLRKKMSQDAEAFELTWLYSEIYPEIEEKIIEETNTAYNNGIVELQVSNEASEAKPVSEAKRSNENYPVNEANKADESKS